MPTEAGVIGQDVHKLAVGVQRHVGQPVYVTVYSVMLQTVFRLEHSRLLQPPATRNRAVSGVRGTRGDLAVNLVETELKPEEHRAHVLE